MAAITPQPFNPQRIFDDAPASTEPAPTIMQVEIDELASQFAALGMNPHSTVALWIGKPNRFTSTVMRSAQEVLDYVSAEHDATAQMQQQVAAVATPAVPAGVVKEARSAAKAAHMLAVQNANMAWREAVRQRNKAMMEWNAYVDTLRITYQNLKAQKVT
jgi:hypothetical protein